MPNNVVHLHVHTEYSMLDGASRIKELVAEAARQEMPALAITDHGVTYGLIDFYRECNEVGVKPILGCELYLARESRFSKLPGDDSPKTIQHITVLAKDIKGYRNLLKLATAASLEGLYYRPRVDQEILAQHSEGLIATTGCLNGNVPRLLLEGRTEEALKAAATWQDIFGKENFFVELQDHGIADQALVNPPLIEISQRLGIPTIATNDLHYTSQADAEAHDVLLCIQTGATQDDPNRFKFDGDQFFLKSRTEMEAALPHHHDAIDRTLDVAERCNVEIEFGDLQLPDFRPPDGSSLDEYLIRLAYEGAEQRYGDPIPQEVRDRLEYELGVINSMGFPGYLLIVADVVRWAKSVGIRVGPGRGSAAGSCVSYCLGIVNLDPIAYNLMFERFLNPERKEMPDIDLDFDERRRGEVIKYLRERYGADRVAQIITFSTIKGKSAIRDSTRVLGLPYIVGDKLAKMFPRTMLGKDPKLADCFEKSSDPSWAYAYTEAAELRKAYSEDPQAKRVLDSARKLEGLRRQTSVHAAAVVVGRDPLVETTALQRTDNGDVVTQFEMHAVEKLGLLKMDILGLSNLTVIDLTIDLLRARGVELDIDHLPLDDPKVFEILQRGESDGVFQMESEGMRRLLKQLRPDRFEDIVALIALYRPGPMNEIPKYIDGKHHPERIQYLHPLLKDFLQDTNGVIVYQEQILQLLQRIAGYTAGEADIVRKAIGKKVKELLASEEPKFLAGAANAGLTVEQARHLWQLIQPFAGYSFNRAHAACYGIVCYQTAYLKAHYPVEYLSALLTSSQDSKDDKTKYLGVARRAGIKVLPPDVNRSESAFAPDPDEPDCVRFGLAGIRNVGEGVVQHVLVARREGGPFADFFDFCWRVDVTVLNKRVVESLIKAGAFDLSDPPLHSRGGLLEVCESVVDQITSARRKERDGYVSLFDAGPEPGVSRTLVGSSLAVPETTLPKPVRMAFEKEMLGQYVTDHPLLGIEAALAAQTNASIASLADGHDGQLVTVAGIVNKVGKKFTRRGEMMYLLDLEDLDANCELIVFPAIAEKCEGLIEMDKILKVKARIDRKDDQPKLVALEITEPDLHVMDRPVCIEVDADACDERFVSNLKEILSEHPGDTPVLLHLRSNGSIKVFRLAENLRVDPEKGCVDRLRLLLGHDAVKS